MQIMHPIISLIRINHYVKNLLIFAGLLFASSAFSNVIGQLLIIFLTFCLTTSCVYVFNDLRDIEQDRLHPLKRNRPLAAGTVSPSRARQLVFLLLALSLLSSWFAGPRIMFLILMYLGINFLYSLKLKHVVLIDAFLLAAGYVIRVLAGTWAVGISPSHWLLLCTLVLSLFLGFSKRHHELTTLEKGAAGHRQVLNEYSETFLNQMIMITATATLVFYSLYTVAPETVAHHQTKNLILTIPFVLYGLFRYMYLIYIRKGGGNPTHEVLSDLSLQLNVLLWATSVLLITRYLK